MKSNFLSSHEYRVDKMWEALLSFSLEYKKRCGLAMSGAAFKRLFIQNVNQKELTISLLVQDSMDKMKELVQMSQGLGLIPKPMSGGKTPNPSTVKIFMTDSSSSSSSSSSGSPPQRPQDKGAQEKHCDKCQKLHRPGNHYCALECGHCHRRGHSKDECNQRKKALAFKKIMKAKAKQEKKALLVAFENYQAQGSTRAMESLQRDFQQMDLQDRHDLAERNRQVLVNMSYRGTQRVEAQHAQQVAYLFQRDGRGSFGGRGRNNDSGVNPTARDDRNLGGVYAPKFPTNSDFCDIQQGQ
jgi:hypothetical protein